jgi:hypothetical protein
VFVGVLVGVCEFVGGGVDPELRLCVGVTVFVGVFVVVGVDVGVFVGVLVGNGVLDG